MANPTGGQGVRGPLIQPIKVSGPGLGTGEEELEKATKKSPGEEKAGCGRREQGRQAGRQQIVQELGVQQPQVGPDLVSVHPGVVWRWGRPREERGAPGVHYQQDTG